MEAALVAAGYSPAEISALVNTPVLDEHASEAAFLWRLRERAIRAPHYRLRQLELLDARVSAHLDALRTAGQAGVESARRSLADVDGGTLFVAAHLAFALDDRAAMRDMMSIALTDAGLMDALVASLAWQDVSQLESVLTALGRSRDSAHRRLCLAAYAAHRIDVGSLLDRSLDDPDAELRARACRAVGELGRTDLVESLHRAVADGSAPCRFWAAWSLALNGDERAARTAFEAGRAEPGLSRASLEIAMRAGEPDWARQLIRSLAGDAATVRQAVIAAGMFGDIAVIPWLLDATERKELARPAAEAFATITGVDLELAALKEDAPEDDVGGHPEDDQLRWPNVEGLRSWWENEHGRFGEGHRYLAGTIVSDSGAVQVLRGGWQRQRRGAALELARLNKGGGVFPVAARADWQRRRLAS